MCNHEKSTNYQAERILFLSIMRIVAPSGLRLSSQPAHAPQADSQGGEIVQRGRGGGRQNTGHTQSDQRAVEADDEAVSRWQHSLSFYNVNQSSSNSLEG